MNITRSIFFLFSWGLAFNLFADCELPLEKQTQKCVQEKSSKFSSERVDINKLSNSIYYFSDSQNNLGAVEFYYTETSDKQNFCSIYYRSKIFSTNGTNEIEGNAEIRLDQGFWNTSKMSFSGDQLVGEFELIREDNQNKDGTIDEDKKLKCYLQPVSAKWTKSHEIGTRKTGNRLLQYSAVMFIFLAVFIIAKTVFTDEESFKTSQALNDGEEVQKTDKKKNNGFILKYSKPFFTRYFSPIVEGMKDKKKFREKYRRPLASAGLTQEMKPEDFYAFKLFLIVGFPIVFVALRSFLEETWPLSFIPLIGLLGFYYPDIWIKGRIEKRRYEITQSMPFVVDMLALSVEAGLDFIAGISRVIEKAPPSALVEEFEILLKEIKIGSNRAEALRSLAWRIDTISISSFCATLIAADSVGASIGPILKVLSKEMRQKRSSDAEKKGATAATKILIPMMLLILPAIFIVIIAPIGLQFMGVQ